MVVYSVYIGGGNVNNSGVNINGGGGSVGSSGGSSCNNGVGSDFHNDGDDILILVIPKVLIFLITMVTVVFRWPY